jgi:putative transposase
LPNTCFEIQNRHLRRGERFSTNHVSQLASVDFFTVHTIWFEMLFVFVILTHDRRRIVHFNVTARPTAEWTAQQILEAFPFDTTEIFIARS